MLSKSYAIGQFSEKLSSIKDLKSLTTLFREFNLRGDIFWGDLRLILPTMNMDGLDDQIIEIHITDPIGLRWKVEVEMLPGEFSVFDLERMLIGSFSNGLKEQLQNLT